MRLQEYALSLWWALQSVKCFWKVKGYKSMMVFSFLQWKLTLLCEVPQLPSVCVQKKDRVWRIKMSHHNRDLNTSFPFSSLGFRFEAKDSSRRDLGQAATLEPHWAASGIFLAHNSSRSEMFVSGAAVVVR